MPLPPKIVEERVEVPSRGVITRIPANQLPHRNLRGAWVAARNMRFDDGVARSAPGFDEIAQRSRLSGTVTFLFQEEQSSGSSVYSQPFIGTETGLFILSRRLDNTVPVVSAGPSKFDVASLTVSLDGSASDPDSLPVSLSLKWRKVSGPGSATFSHPTSAVTDVTVSTGGTYVFRLLAFDGASTSWSDVEVVFIP